MSKHVELRSSVCLRAGSCDFDLSQTMASFFSEDSTGHFAISEGVAGRGVRAMWEAQGQGQATWAEAMMNQPGGQPSPASSAWTTVPFKFLKAGSYACTAPKSYSLGVTESPQDGVKQVRRQ